VTVRSEKGLRQKSPVAAVRRAALQALRVGRFPNGCSVGVLLAGKATVTELNAKYRGLKRTTDVLSFFSGAEDPQAGEVQLGDVVICLPQAVVQARARGESPEQECALLAVHGVLHLLGYDHDTPARKARMWRAQRKILAELEKARPDRKKR
jgi:probable rRNA maturation factor